MTEASKPDTPTRVGLSEGLVPLPEPDLLVDCALGFVRGWTKSALDGVLKLAAFGAWCAREFRRDLADVDGGSAQDEMARIGVLELHEALEPCGEGCVCAEYGDFPHECFRLAANVRPLVDGGPNVKLPDKEAQMKHEPEQTPPADAGSVECGLGPNQPERKNGRTDTLRSMHASPDGGPEHHAVTAEG